MLLCQCLRRGSPNRIGQLTPTRVRRCILATLRTSSGSFIPTRGDGLNPVAFSLFHLPPGTHQLPCGEQRPFATWATRKYPPSTHGVGKGGPPWSPKLFLGIIERNHVETILGVVLARPFPAGFIFFGSRRFEGQSDKVQIFRSQGPLLPLFLWQQPGRVHFMFKPIHESRTRRSSVGLALGVQAKGTNAGTQGALSGSQGCRPSSSASSTRFNFHG